MKNIIGQIMSCIVIQALINGVAVLHGVEPHSLLWWALILGGGSIFNTGVALRD